MKTIAALIAGLILSTATFVGGLFTALVFLNAGEPEHRLGEQDTAALWTTEPVGVDKAAQSFERLPARPVSKERTVAASSKAGTGARAVNSLASTEDSSTREPVVDPVTTGAVETSEPGTEASRPTWRTTAHSEWCARRYRSYDAADNSYRPYGGGRKACRSPYSDVAATDTAPGISEEASAATTVAQEQPADEDLSKVDQASLDEAPDSYVDSEQHIRSCFARYRSYRPEDNTYQPFDGGARRQCR